MAKNKNGGRGSGSPSLAGYEYQIDVSVWLALELIVVARLTDVLMLEPATQEDLEAELSETEPGRVVSRVPLDGYTLIVQAKRKSGDAWTPTTLKSLLEHGSDIRISAAKRLSDTKSRYLLVTSAGLNGDARKLKVRRAGNWPGKTSVPGVIKRALKVDVAGRLAVIANEDDERLNGDIDRLLLEGCRTPTPRLAECKRRLRDDARARILGAGGGRWARADLEAVIRLFDGYLASSPELEHFVHPGNWPDLRAAMNARHAAIMVGQSGTGKTLSTKKLYDELRQEIPGLTRVPIRFGPGELRDKLADTAIPPPVLYDIEDPWGRFDFDPRSRPWNDQLAGFFANARPDRMIIATSRADVAQASGAIGDLTPWIVPLESENYDKGRRQRLYRTRIDGLPRDLQQLARQAETRVLARLATPLEIQKFFDAVRTQDRAGLKHEHAFIEDAIDAAQESAIEKTVIAQIETRDDVRAAAIIWALLTASDKVTRTLVRDLEDALADRDAAMEKGISPFVDFFVAARNLRQADDGMVTYYHPRVEHGIERALAEHRVIARRTIVKLLDLLVSSHGPGPEWGVGAAARILAVAAEKFGTRPSAATTGLVDDWLAARVIEGGKNFDRHLDLAARAGSPASNAGEVARFVLRRTDNSFGFDWREAEDHPDAWYAARRADPTTKPILDTFVEQQLPRNGRSYPKSFAAILARLASGLTPAFLTAAHRAVRGGVLSSDDAIAEGALDDLEGFEAVVDEAVDELTPTEKQLRDGEALQLDIVNDVFDEDYAQHISESDEGYTASEFLKLYVQRVRRVKGWQSVAQHRHAVRLRTYWLRALAEESRKKPPAADEFASAFQSGFDTDDEDDLWLALLAAWDERMLLQLRARVDAGSPKERIDQSAMTCIIEHAPAVLSEIVTELEAAGNVNRLVEVALTLAYLRRGRSRDGSKHIDAADYAARALPPPYRSIVDAALALGEGRTPRLAASARAVLLAIDQPSPSVRRLRLDLDQKIGLAVTDDAHWALDEAEDSRTAVAGIEAAIRHGMTAAIERALGHRFAHVASRALTALATPLAAPLPAAYLDLATHRTSPIRLALGRLLAEKPHPQHQPALMILAGDQWSRHSRYYGNDDTNLPIARIAAEALAKQPALPPADTAKLLAIATETADPQVRRTLLTLLAQTGGTAIQDKIFDLAVQPGRASVRRGADYALLQAAGQLDRSIIGKISADLLATRFEPVAATLALLLGWRGTRTTIRDIAATLATNPKRRGLLLLVILLLKDRDRAVAEEIAAMLPAGHRAVRWALGEPLKKVDDAVIADLGDQAVCAEILVYMRIDEKSAGKRKAAAKSLPKKQGG